MRILFISSLPPPRAGMSLQGKYILNILRKLGHNLTVFKINHRYFIKLMLAILFPVILPVIGFMADKIFIISSVYGSFYFFTIPALIYSRISGKPLILLFKGGKVIITLKKVHFVKHIFKIADKIVVPGDFLKSVFSSYKIKTIIMPDIIDTSYLKVNDDFGKGEYFLMTRALEKIYGIDTAIKAYYEARPRLKGKRLIITGSGKERKKIENMVRELNLEDCVLLKGECCAEKIGNLLSKAFALLNTSYYDNYPNSILEAFYSMVPVLSTDAGGIPYIIKDRVNGILTRQKDAKKIASAMINMIENEDKLYEITKKAREDINELILSPTDIKTFKAISNLITKGCP
jgi:glycosyltransferase involved in cell wall biosynthesis